jgi:acyl-CoA synthetase (AMP-forming)/AMP-acid ligase II
MIHPYSHYPARAARHWPNHVALREGERKRTYAELNTNADIIARGLIKLGLQPEDRVTLIQRNCIEYVESVIGIARAGGTLVPMLGALTEAEHAFMLNDAEAKFIIVMAPEDGDRALAIAGNGISVVSFHAAEGITDLTSLTGPDDDLPVFDLHPSSLAHILYSSGTTGRPKGITHSYAGVTSAMNFWAKTFDLQPEDNLLGQLALSHFCGRAMDSCWVAGGTLVILPEADPVAILDAIDEHKVTMMLAVPTLLRILLDHPAADSADFSSLRVVVYAASPAAPSLVRRARQKLGSILHTGYGQTEAYGLNTFMGPEEHEQALTEDESRLTSIGRECPNAQVRIRDEDGRDVERGEVGEIWVCAPWTTPGFWRRPELDEARLENGWLRTGDLGRMDEDGFFYLADRKEDMMISGGFNVYPAEVENALLENEAVAECGVFSVPDEKWGEAVNASVVLRPGHDIGADELISFAKTQLAKFKVPKTIFIVEELPKTAVGKILRRVLREPFWKDQTTGIHGAE